MKITRLSHDFSMLQQHTWALNASRTQGAGLG
jgi:hypothetical protein